MNGLEIAGGGHLSILRTWPKPSLADGAKYEDVYRSPLFTSSRNQPFPKATLRLPALLLFGHNRARCAVQLTT